MNLEACFSTFRRVSGAVLRSYNESFVVISDAATIIGNELLTYHSTKMEIYEKLKVA